MVNLPEKKEQTFTIPAGLFDNPYITKFDMKLYGNIVNLTHQYGYCDASNKYLAQKIHACKRTIKRGMTKLEELGYILIEKKGYKQKIFLPTQTQSELQAKPTQQTQGFDIAKVLALVDSINAKQTEHYPGYDPVRYLERPFGVQIRLIIFTLAKAYFNHEFIGTTLGGKTVTDELMQNLIEVFDLSLIHGLANYLVDHFEDVEDIDRYILSSLINAHKKSLKQKEAGAS